MKLGSVCSSTGDVMHVKEVENEEEKEVVAEEERKMQTLGYDICAEEINEDSFITSPSSSHTLVNDAQ